MCILLLFVEIIEYVATTTEVGMNEIPLSFLFIT